MDEGIQVVVASREMIEKIFHFNMSNVQQLLEEQYGEELTERITPKVEEVFQQLVLDLPWIGGDKNPLTATLIWATVWLAVYQTMQIHGYHVTDVGKMIYDEFLLTTRRFNAEELQRVQSHRFSQEYLDEQRQMALESQKSTYPENWEFDFVEGDGVEFDWGLDYRKCAICTFYHSHGADELVQFICLTDFYSSRALGLGLERTQTIADGFDLCNFRFKQGRITKPNWVPAFLRDVFGE